MRIVVTLLSTLVAFLPVLALQRKVISQRVTVRISIVDGNDALIPGVAVHLKPWGSADGAAVVCTQYAEPLTAEVSPGIYEASLSSEMKHYLMPYRRARFTVRKDDLVRFVLRPALRTGTALVIGRSVALSDPAMYYAETSPDQALNAIVRYCTIGGDSKTRYECPKGGRTAVQFTYDNLTVVAEVISRTSLQTYVTAGEATIDTGTSVLRCRDAAIFLDRRQLSCNGSMKQF